MHEIEIKILGIDRKKIESQLIALGAKKIFDDDIHALYYDSADDGIRRKKGTFRLRKEGPLTILTFKEHIEDNRAKVREEVEVEVSDFSTMRSILEAVGFSSWLEMKKHRTTYAYEDVRFEFDKYYGEFDYIPEFLEIEGTHLHTVYTYVELLGFDKKDCKPWDSLQVAKYYAHLK